MIHDDYEFKESLAKALSVHNFRWLEEELVEYNGVIDTPKMKKLISTIVRCMVEHGYTKKDV